MNGPKKSARRMQLDELRCGDTAAFFPNPGDEHGIYQTVNDRWVKLEDKAFTIRTGLYVVGNEPSNCCKVILITRTK